MTARHNRRLPNRYARYFMRAIQDEIGVYSLRMMLRNAGLERYIEAWPPDNSKQEILASEFAALHNAICEYFGSGARGSLYRIGRIIWQMMLEDASIGTRVGLLAARLLPPLQRSRRALEYLATQMRKPDGDVSVHLLDQDLIFMDTSSDSTFGYTADEPICWATLGMIQAALFWATGAEQAVDEISCRAAGATACKFRIRLSG
ncbi:MAG: hypothetical protein KKD28_01410 [Chloroflexi bacterium]|nr:hypothetical protein [Chloroflexota bacterium]MBU1660111.1 hypothetical protein [Chloroflexota bacterium]